MSSDVDVNSGINMTVARYAPKSRKLFSSGTMIRSIPHPDADVLPRESVPRFLRVLCPLASRPRFASARWEVFPLTGLAPFPHNLLIVVLPAM